PQPVREPKLEQERALAWSKQLLRAFGGVTGAIVNAYAPFGWESAEPFFKQLEEWGVVTRGLFVEGIPALQYMERDTIPALRGWDTTAAPAPAASATAGKSPAKQASATSGASTTSATSSATPASTTSVTSPATPASATSVTSPATPASATSATAAASARSEEHTSELQSREK